MQHLIRPSPYSTIIGSSVQVQTLFSGHVHASSPPLKSSIRGVLSSTINSVLPASLYFTL